MTLSPCSLAGRWLIIAAMDSTLNERVAEEIRVMLARRQITATELARKAGMTQRSISRRITGEKAIDMDDLDRIAGALGVDVLDLIPATDNEPRPRRSTGPRVVGRRRGNIPPSWHATHRAARTTRTDRAPVAVTASDDGPTAPTAPTFGPRTGRPLWRHG